MDPAEFGCNGLFLGCQKDPKTMFIRLTYWLVFLGLGSIAHADLSFRAMIEPDHVFPGERMSYRLDIVSPSRQSSLNPSVPDFGGLTIVSGPTAATQIINRNGRVRFYQSFEWILSASEPGRYVIGPSVLESDDRTYRTEKINLVVKPQSEDGLPRELHGEGLIFGQTGDHAENRRLRNRLFIRPQVSNESPFVGEPVVLAYALYIDGITLGDRAEFILPEVEGALDKQLYQAQSFEGDEFTYDNGKTFKVITLYRHVVTPTRPGDLRVTGFGLRTSVVGSQRRRTRSMFDDLFERGVRVELPTPPINLSVKPVPHEEMPDKFTGTVGDFILAVGVDRNDVGLDDLITMKVQLSGRGAIDLANPPTLDLGDHFSLAGESVDVRLAESVDDLRGHKIFEYVLRPGRSGRLELPELSYILFDPYAAEFRTLKSDPLQFNIAPGPEPFLDIPDPSMSPDGAMHGPVAGEVYLRPMLDLRTGRSGTIVNKPLFWIFHLAAIGMLVVGWGIDNRRSKRDPERERRRKAWRQFEKRIQHVGKGVPDSANLANAAGELESATRKFIADHFNLAADGLTRPMIEERLFESAMGFDQVNRLCELMDRCISLKYAPQSMVRSFDLQQCRREMTRILREVKS